MNEYEYIKEQLKDHTVADANNFNEINGKLDRILEQTTRHNGRLTKLERYIYMILGGLIIVSVIVVPLFLGSIGQ